MIEDLQAAFLAADADGVRRELDALDQAGLREARRWATGLRGDPWALVVRAEDVHDVHRRQSRAQLVLLFRLLTAQHALARVLWYMCREDGPLLAEVLARPPEWRADFVRVAGNLRLSEGWRAAPAWTIYPVVREVCARDGLEVPWNELLVRGWLFASIPRTYDDRYRRVGAPDVAAMVRAEGHLEAVPLAFQQRRLSEFEAFAPVVVALVEGGELARADVIDWCLTALDSPGRPSDQTVVADILLGVGLCSGEVPGGLARLQQLLATCHGSVTGRLLPLALDLLASTDDVAELAATMAARPEKKQRTDLLRVLTATDTRARLGDEAVRAGLEVLAENTDAALAGKVASALQRLGTHTGIAAARAVATTAPRLGLWDLVLEDARPPNDAFGELGTFDDGAVAVVRHAALNQPRRQALEPFYEPTALSIVVRWAWQDGADAVRARLQAAGPIETLGYDDTMLGRLLPDWLDGPIDPDGERGWWRRYWARTERQPGSWTPAEAEFAARHMTESLNRAGRIPFLLSTPNRPNGGLDLEVLVDRLRASADVGFGPLDLLQAILRLRPLDPARARELDGLPPVPPDTSAGTTTSVPDAVAYVRDAVAAGRFLPPFITPERLLQESWAVEQPPAEFWLAMLPVDPADLGSSLDELAPAQPLDNGATDYRHVAPWCPDLRLRPGGLWLPAQGWSSIPVRLTEAAGPMGVAVHDALFREYASDRAHSRQDAVRLTLDAIGRRVYAPPAAVTAAAGRLVHGRLNLSRCAEAWEQVFLACGLRVVWQVALATAALAVEQPRRPPGLSDLLRLLTTYVGEVPDRDVPPRLAAFAAEKGSTKGHAEARHLVAALET